jgi:hypothetical protein
MWSHLLILVLIVVVGLVVFFPWPAAPPLALGLALAMAVVACPARRGMRQRVVKGQPVEAGSTRVRVRPWT